MNYSMTQLTKLDRSYKALQIYIIKAKWNNSSVFQSLSGSCAQQKQTCSCQRPWLLHKPSPELVHANMTIKTHIIPIVAKKSSKEKSCCAMLRSKSVTFVVNGDTAKTVAHRNLLK